MTGAAFFWPWEPSVTVVSTILAMAVLYVRGCARVRPCLSRQISFWSGLAVLYVSLHTQFDYYAEHMFFLHRAQHALLHHMGPFLIALGAPGPVLWAGLSPNVQASLRRLHPVFAPLINPAVATILFCALFVLWLLPGAQFVGMLDWRWYRAMNWSVLACGLLFWCVAFDPGRPPPLRIAMLLAILPVQIGSGALLCLSGREAYAVYSLCGRALLGLSPLADQALGGVIIWLDGVMMSVLGILIVVRRDVLRRP